MATRADIEINVKGLKKVQELSKLLDKVSGKVNQLNKSGGAAAATKSNKLEKESLSIQEKKRASMVRVRSIGDQIAKAKAKGLNVDKASRALNRAALANSQGKFKLAKASGDAALLELKAQQSITKQLTQQKILKATQSGGFGGAGGKGGGGGALSSALISGTFPLLFGQGPLAAAGGFAGGFIGDKMGGKMGGFAGGLVGTATITLLQQGVTSIGELGQAMSTLNPDITALSRSMGIMGTIEERRLQIIEQTQGKQAALNAALEMMGDKIGEENVEELRKFGEAFRNLTNSTVEFFTKVQAAVAKLLNQAVDAGADANLRGRSRSLVAENPNNAAFRDINKQIADLEAQRSGAGREGAKDIGDRINILKQERLEIAETIILEKDKDKLRVKTNKLITAGLGDLQKENELNKAIIAGNEEEFLVKQAIKDKVEEMGLVMEKLTPLQLERIRNDVTTNKNLKEQARLAKAVNDAFEKLSTSILNDVKEGIKGLIKGTSTLGDLLNNVADRFLDVALNQALFGSILGSEGKKGGGIFGALGLFANGGRPPVGKPSIVGEKGPELFVPRSSGTIVPNNKLGGGGSTSVVVNVDASGTNVQGNEAQGKELGTLLSVAVQQELLKQQRPGGLLASIR